MKKREPLTDDQLRALPRARLLKLLQASEQREYTALTASIEAGNRLLVHSQMVTKYMDGTLNDAGRASLEAWQYGKALRDEKSRRMEFHGSLRPTPVPVY